MTPHTLTNQKGFKDVSVAYLAMMIYYFISTVPIWRIGERLPALSRVLITFANYLLPVTVLLLAISVKINLKKIIVVSGLIVIMIFTRSNFNAPMLDSYANSIMLIICLFFLSQGFEYTEICEGLLKAVFWGVVVTFILAGAGLLSHITMNTASYAGGAMTRRTIGYSSPNQTAYYYYELFILSLIVFNRHPKKNLIITSIGLGISLFLYFYIVSRTAVYVIMISLIFFFMSGKMKDIKKLNSLRFLPIVLCFITYMISHLYNPGNSIMKAINNATTGRLKLSNYFVQNYPLSLFGNRVLFSIGAALDEQKGYLFLDSGYLQLLLVFGLMYTVFYIGSMVYVSKKAVEVNNLGLFIAVLSTSLYLVVEVLPLGIGRCFFIPLIFSTFSGETTPSATPPAPQCDAAPKEGNFTEKLKIPLPWRGDTQCRGGSPKNQINRLKNEVIPDKI